MAAPSKRCPRCDQDLPASSFWLNKHHRDGLTTYCKPCQNEVRRASYKRHSKAIVARTTAYNLAHPERAREWQRRWRARHAEERREAQMRLDHGIGFDDYRKLEAAQGGACAICRQALRLEIDHDESSRIIRGLLCPNCNKGLGNFRDDPVHFRAAIVYLQTPPAVRVLGPDHVHPGRRKRR